MKFSRHARNGLRWLRIDAADGEELIATSELRETDREGRLRYYGEINSIPVRVVLATDDPDFVITIHRRDWR